MGRAMFCESSNNSRPLAGLSDEELRDSLVAAYAEADRLRQENERAEAKLHLALDLGHEVLTRGTRSEIEARHLAAVAMRDTISTLEKTS